MPNSLPSSPTTSSIVPTVPCALPKNGDWLDALCQQLRRWCGVYLDSSKSYLIENRLRGLITELHFGSYEEMIAAAKQVGGTAVRDRIVDALTTHETLFFRDTSPFDALAKVIVPEIRDATRVGKPRLRVWSAACSSGQEPYSIAIKLLESVDDLSGWNISILASDVSSGTVAAARKGIYQDHEIRRGISESQKRAFFEAHGEHWQLKNQVRRLIQFQVGNLDSASQPVGPFDLIYCRNVLIYFTPEDANRILRVVASRLAPGGRLFVGCSEVLRNVGDFLVAEKVGNATCYRRRE